MNITMEFFIFKLVSVENCSLKQQFRYFRANLPKKGYFGSKAKNVSITFEFSIFKSVKILNFSLNQQFSFLGPKLPKTSISPLKHKSEYHYWIVHIQIGLNTKFQFYIAILTFWNKFTQKGYFKSKTEKVNITIEFCIFKLVQIWSFSLK